MIHLLKEKTTPAQLQEMLERFEGMIKIVVDIRRRFLSGGGESNMSHLSTFVRVWETEAFCYKMKTFVNRWRQ